MFNVDQALSDALAMQRIIDITKMFTSGSKTDYSSLILIQHVLNKALSNKVIARNWVKVEEKLPAQNFAVLVIDDHFEQFVGWLIGDKWHTSDCCECIVETVTHWRDLPPEPDYRT